MSEQEKDKNRQDVVYKLSNETSGKVLYNDQWKYSVFVKADSEIIVFKASLTSIVILFLVDSYFSITTLPSLISVATQMMLQQFLSFSLCVQFVAQPNCQQLLATLWYDGFPGWRRRHWVVKLVLCFIIGLLFPVFSLVCKKRGSGGKKRRERNSIQEIRSKKCKWLIGNEEK